ncbi:6798_t:CDS:2, partial [Rhizophagus irregularis]
ISQAIKRHVKLGCTIESGDDIEAAIHDIAGTKVANLLPNRNQDDSVTNDELLELDLLNSSLNSMDITNVIGSSKKQM